MPDEFLHALWDPTAPLPAGWPNGILGAFLLFLMPIGGGIPLVVLTVSTSLLTGRSAAAAAGHGFLPGWTLAIAGDMLYFGLLMVSTLWLSSVLDDQRLVVGLVFGITLVAPVLLRRMRSGGRT